MEKSEFSREEPPRLEVNWTDYGNSWEYRVEIPGVGHIVCDVGRDRSGELSAYRRDFAVQPSHQGKGYGKAIMQEALAIAQSCGITHVVGEADSPRTVGILREIMGDDAVVVRDVSQESEQFSTSMTPAQAVEYLSGATTQDPTKEGYRSLVLDVNVSRLNIKDRQPALERDRPAALPTVGRPKEQEREKGQTRERGDDAGPSQSKGRELPYHDEFGRPITQEARVLGQAGRESIGRELGDVAVSNVAPSPDSGQKDARSIDLADQARSLAFSSQSNPSQEKVREQEVALGAANQPVKAMDARERGDEIMQTQGKRQGRLGKFLDNVRDRIPGVSTSRTKENNERLLEIAAASTQMRRAVDAREQELVRGLRDREFSQSRIDAWREQHGSLVAAINNADYKRTIAEREQAREGRSQIPEVSQQQKTREALDAHGAAQAAKVRAIADEAKSQARSVADNIGKTQQPRTREHEGREIDMLARLLESNRPPEPRSPIRGDDEHTKGRGKERELPQGQQRELGDVTAQPLSPELQQVKALHQIHVQSAEKAREREALARATEYQRLQALGKDPRDIAREMDAWDAARRAEAHRVTRGRVPEARERSPRTRER